MKNQQKALLFEEIPIPKAVATLAVPTVLSSLVMVLYNLADTYFVGMCNDPIQNAAVTLAAPVLLAFNAVNLSLIHISRYDLRTGIIHGNRRRKKR